MKRLGVVLAALALLVVAAPVASAQAGASVSIGGASNGQNLQGTIGLRANASSSAGIRHIQLQIDSVVVASKDFDGLQTSVSLPYSWNTNGTRNGAHTIRVYARAIGGGEGSTAINVGVDNAPATPSGFTASESGGTVSMSWNANPESDIIGYRVERDGGGGWQSIGQTGATSYSDQPGTGDFSYRVVALRNSPTSSGGKASAPSGSATVQIAAPPPSGSDGGTGTGTGGTGGQTGGSGGSGSGSGSGGSGSGSGNNNGGSVPGYGKGSSGGSRKGSAGTPGGGHIYGGSFTSAGKKIASLGLPKLSSFSLPGGRGLADLPALPEQEAIYDDTFEETLPYAVGSSGRTAAVPGAGMPNNVAAMSPWRVIPPDGLRWVGAGLWFVVAALFMKFLERRVAEREVAAAAAGTPELTVVPNEDEAAA